MNHISRWIKDDGIELANRPRKNEVVGLRFGKFSRNARSINFDTGVTECGLSVYRAAVVDGVVALDDAVPMEYAQELCTRCVFPVVGVLAGVGSDGEMVIRRPRLLRMPVALSVWREIARV